MQYKTDAGYFGVYLKSEEASTESILANQTEAGFGSSYQAKDGTYALTINADGRWQIKIIQVSP
jgi:hypothetical protein